ncbi:MAG TPA: hypothetical protein VFN02_09415 [Ktedonobacteraceae bacterium]|nr:hypothetical protein [Ktedonobacteraceae bacterium]
MYISYTSLVVGFNDLSPFAMSWAFPRSDYYGDSVTLALAGGR